MTDNEDPIVPALILFHDWLRERLIEQEGADPLGDSADAVTEFMNELIDSTVSVLSDLFGSLGMLNGE